MINKNMYRILYLEEFGIRSLNIRQKHDNNNSFDSSYCIVTRVLEFLLSTIIFMPCDYALYFPFVLTRESL